MSCILHYKYDRIALQEHVTNARQTATQAVQAIMGTASGPYDYLPYFYSRVFSQSWQFWGFSECCEVAHFGNYEGGKFGAYFVKGGKVSVPLTSVPARCRRFLVCEGLCGHD